MSFQKIFLESFIANIEAREVKKKTIREHIVNLKNFNAYNITSSFKRILD